MYILFFFSFDSHVLQFLVSRQCERHALLLLYILHPGACSLAYLYYILKD